MHFHEFTSFFEKFCQFCLELELVRYDCAIDIPLPREKIKMLRTGKSNYEYQYHETKEKTSGVVVKSSVTEYQGRRNHNKFCKLYDKRAESKLDYDLSRVEFTFSRDELEFKNLPQFFVYDSKIIKELDFTKLTQNDLVFVDLMRNSEDKNMYLKNLTYRFRKKIEPFLNDYCFTPNIETIKQVRDLALYFEI